MHAALKGSYGALEKCYSLVPKAWYCLPPFEIGFLKHVLRGLLFVN
jgi:hypothetical protein